MAPAGGLPQGTCSQAATFDQRGEARRFARIAALPARQTAVAHGDAMKRGKGRCRSGFQTVGYFLLRRLVASAEQAEAVDEQRLFERRAADQSSVVELGGGERPRETGLT